MTEHMSDYPNGKGAKMISVLVGTDIFCGIEVTKIMGKAKHQKNNCTNPLFEDDICAKNDIPFLTTYEVHDWKNP